MLTPMPRPLRLLLVEDSPSDAELLLRQLAREGLEVEPTRVETRAEMLAALGSGSWDIVVSDYGLPQFSGLEAIVTALAFDPDLPVILVSGTVGEETAAAVMRAGARDFILKDSLARLAMVLQREVKDAQLRRAQRREAHVMLKTQAIARAGGWEWRLEGNDLFVTEGVLRLLEAPENYRLTSENSVERLAPGELSKVQEFLNSTQDSLELDVRVKTFTGKELTVRVVARVERRNDAIWRMVGAILDVTEHRQLEASVRLNDRLAAMGTIAAGVAHEINNPLTHLVASLPLVLDAVKKNTSSSHEVEMLEGCIEGAQRIAAIVRDLKVFSRPDESEADTEVAAVLTSVLNLLNLEYRHRSAIHAEVPNGLRVAAPSARLAQVLTNQIINAVQAMPVDRSSAKNLIKVVGSAERGTVTIEVSDNGSGMSAEVKSRLFAPFFTTKPVGEGTGLGLSVVRSIITGLNGTIEVESAEGLGTRFIVKLPEGKRVAEPVLAPAPQASGRSLRLLLVDDEPFLRRVTHRLLQPHEVVEASSADEGLSILARDQRFDVILCDLMMPGRSGTDFYRDLSARSPQLANRFLFVSGGAVTAETEAFLREVTPDRVVLKPYTYVQLHSAVERVAAQQP